MRTAVRIVGRLMIVAGVLGLVCLVGWRWWGNEASAHAQAQTVQSLERQFRHSQAPATHEPPTHATRDAGNANRGTTSRLAGDESRRSDDQGATSPARTTPGDAFALIRIPRFGGDFVRPIVQGTGTAELKEGVGHYLGTAAPGQRGNFAVAGHRTTYGKPFNQIAELRPGDRIIVQTAKHTYTYRVTGHTVVAPTDVQVITPDPPGVKPGHLMTMTSCHPMYSALERYVVHARLISTT